MYPLSLLHGGVRLSFLLFAVLLISCGQQEPTGSIGSVRLYDNGPGHSSSFTSNADNFVPQTGTLLTEIQAAQMQVDALLLGLDEAWQQMVVAHGPEALAQALESLPAFIFMLRQLVQNPTLFYPIMELIRQMHLGFQTLEFLAPFLALVMEAAASITALMALVGFTATGVSEAILRLEVVLKNQLNDLNQLRCPYHYLDGPQIDAQSWYNYTPEFAMRTALQFSTQFLTFWRQKGARVIELIGDPDSVLVCGRVTYQPHLFSVQYAELHKEYRGSQPEQIQPARRVTMTLFDAQNRDIASVLTSDQGDYFIQIPTARAYEVVAIGFDTVLAVEHYQPDSVGPDACDGASWTVPVELASGQESGQYSVSAYSIRPGNQGGILMYRERFRIAAEANWYKPIHITYTSGPAAWWESTMIASLFHMEALNLFFEQICKAVPDMQFPDFVYHWPIKSARDVLRWDGNTYVVGQVYNRHIANMLHEIMHAAEFMLHQRADNFDAGGRGYDEDPRNAFSESWGRAHQIFMLDDGTAHGITSYQDLRTGYSPFRDDAPTIHNMGRGVKTLLELESVLGYEAIYRARDGQFSETPGYTNMFAYLAHLYALSDQGGQAAIVEIVQEYLGISSGDAFVCPDGDEGDYCRRLNGAHAPIDVFDTRNYLGQAAAAQGYDPISWALYDLFEVCPMLEGHQASSYNKLYKSPLEGPAGMESTPYGDRTANRLYACPADAVVGPTVAIRDTEYTCTGENRSVRLRSHQTGRRFDFQEAEQWGEFGLIDSARGACPSIAISNADDASTLLFDASWWSDHVIECFSFQEWGCAHYRSRY